MKRLAVPALVSITAIGAGAPAIHAQDESQQGTALEEIVVSARKRNESLQEAPVSVTAFSSAELQDRGSRSFADLMRVIPNVTTTNGLSIRGISYNQRNVGIEAGAGIYVDGVHTGRIQTFNQDLTDVERVEVLRGPQGTLFGKNSIAGAVNIVTHRPVDRFEGSVLADVGNMDHRRAELMLNVPMGSITALRINGFTSEEGGFVRNLLDGGEYERGHATGGRAALAIHPAEQLEITLRGDYFKELRRDPYPESSLGEDPQTFPRQIIAPGPNSTVLTLLPQGRRSMTGGSLTAEYKIADDLTFTSISAYRRNTDLGIEEEDNSPLDNIQVDFRDWQKQWTQEFRLNGRAASRVDYVAGLYYYRQDATTSHAGILGTDFAIPIPGGFLVPPGMLKPTIPIGEIDTKAYAAFLDTTISVTPKFDVLAGVRYTKEDKDFDFRIDASPGAAPLFYTIPRDTDSASDSDVSPTVGLRYRFNDDFNTYFRFAKGFKSGGWNADFIAATPGKPAPTVQSLYFRPEQAKTYEVGFKAETLAKRLRINAAVFYTDYTNLQVSQFFGINLDEGGELAVTGNAGSATIKGAELEVMALPVNNLTVTFGAGYQTAKYDTFENVDGAGGNANGRSFSGVPKFTLNASADYIHPLASSASLKARVDWSYRDAVFGDVQNTARLTTPGFGLVNARVGYAQDKWEVNVFAFNLLDREYLTAVSNDGFAVAQGAAPVTDYRYGRPRTYGLEARITF
jgi:iron complex outermembrane receptor protein